MKSFFLPVGRFAGASLPALLSALSCGAALPVTDLNILYITEEEADPLVPAMIRDLNRVHALLDRPDNESLFPSSFSFDSFRPVLPSHRALSGDPASSALLGALRGKGMPLSYKTDREAVEWAFSALLSDLSDESAAPLRAWFCRISDALAAEKDVRVAVLCDVFDPFSAGIAFAVLRHLKDTVGAPSSSVALFCSGVRSDTAAGLPSETFEGCVRALCEQDLVGTPDKPGLSCADAVWLVSQPASLSRSADALRVLYVALARQLARFCASEKDVAPGLHTSQLPGILTLESLGDRAASFACFVHASAWILSDLLPALTAYCERPAALRSLTPNTRNGLFRRLFSNEAVSPEQRELLPVLKRALSAVLSEFLSLIRSMPDQFRLAEVSDPAWQKIVEACGRTVTVASEYDVSKTEAEEGGFLNVKPVHRVSLADTEEEKAERRLEDIAVQLKDEEEGRNRLFASLGGCWSVLALRNCRERCLAALSRAREQLARQTVDTDAAKLSFAAASRRVRLLEAAVERCDRDLADPDLRAKITEGTPAMPGVPSPFSCELLDAGAAEKLSVLITPSEAPAEPARKDVVSAIPSLFRGFTLSEVKTLFRKLLSVCKQDPEGNPLSYLFLSALEVSRGEVASLRFVSSGKIPSVPLLPDLYPSGPVLTVSALLPLLPSAGAEAAGPVSEKRGLLAMLLLRQYRRRNSDEASLTFDFYRSEDSPVLRAWLSARNADRVWILSLSKEENSLPFALVLPGRGLIPARITAAHTNLLPAFAAPWFDPDTLSFRDPCALLGDSDRIVLGEQLSRMASELPDRGSPLCAFLESFREDLDKSREEASVPDNLTLRLKAAFGLRLLPAFRPTLVCSPCSYERSLPSDGVAARLTDKPSFPASSGDVPDDIVFLYKDIPFARENPRTLLDRVPLPAEKWILSLLEKECDTLARSSDDYHDHLVRELSKLLERYPDAKPEARQIALDLLERASKPVTDTDTELTWPWDPMSPSVLTILSEALGEAVATSALRPFSDQLALFPARGNEVIGDSLMASMCVLAPASVPAPEEGEEAPAVSPDAVLPPFSAGFCSALCRLPEGRTLVRSGLLDFERKEENAIRVTLTLEGRFTVRLIRDYAEEEILHLYSHDIPTLAVWPNLPFAPEDWHAYFIYAGLPSSITFTAYNAEGQLLSPSGDGGRAVCRSDTFPLSFTFFRENLSIGSVPNLLPAPVIEKSEPYTACIDFGSVGTSVVFSVGHRRIPLQGPTLVRTLLNNPAVSRDLLRKEFLPAVPVSALLPTASRIFRNVPGEAPLPFEDGIVLMSSDMQDVLSIPSGALYTCLKWEEDKGRSVSLCLHQIMLMAALQARYGGASFLSWRFSVPDEMAKAGRERLAALFTSLAEQVGLESGFRPPEKYPLVTFAPESSALGAYFRFCASEDTRGGFMVLDIGACTADISLFLRGREQAVRTCQIPLGVHYMLLPSLLRDPDMLRQDFGFIEDPAFRQELLLLEKIIRNAKADPAALRHSRLALDNFIADRYVFLLPALLQNPATGMPSKLGSVLLLHFSYLMMLSGLVLLQIAADPGKNDFLPEQMSLCLSGRGSILPESLPDQYKTCLWHFLTMFRNRRVASLSMLFSSEKKMEIPVGLSVLQTVSADVPPASAIPAAISVRPEELLPQFLLRFAKEFPASAELLFHGFFSGDFYHPFTPYGESLVTEAISQSFTDRTALLPFDALSAWIGSLLDLIDSSAQ